MPHCSHASSGAPLSCAKLQGPQEHAGRHASKQLLEHQSGSGAQQEAQYAIPALCQRASRITARQRLCTERITPHARSPLGRQQP